MEKIDVGEALHDTNYALLRSSENQADLRAKRLFLESCKQIYYAASGNFKLKAIRIKLLDISRRLLMLTALKA